jgi:hypothetical protein
MQAEMIRSEVSRLVRRSPFQPFVLLLENGDRVMIDHLPTSQRSVASQLNAVSSTPPLRTSL